MKIREAKGKEEKERYTHLNAEFQKNSKEEIRKASSVIDAKKLRKTIEWERLENSSRKRDTKEISHAKMGTIKDRNGVELIEADRKSTR